MCATRPAQSTQNSKFADLCNIPEKYGSEVDFLPENKQKFSTSYSITLGLCSQTCPNYPKQQVYNILVISQGKYEG